MPNNKAEIIIESKDMASKAIKQISDDFKSTTSKAVGYVKKLSSVVTGTLGGAISKTMKMLTSLKTLAVGAFVGWGLKNLAQGFLDVGSKMESLRISLDTITKGHGDEWFEKLNAWALKMPVNTGQAIRAFTQMRAMGLQPTTEDMTKLVDAASAVGAGHVEETLAGIAIALGQMKTKGKASAEEMMQLAERSIPAFEILKEKLKLTQKQLGNIGAQSLDVDKVIQALIEGMGERYAGQSQRIQKSWDGLTTSLRSYWDEFKRLVMDSGVLKYMEDQLDKIIKKLDQWNKDGSLKKWAKETGKFVTDMFEKARKKADEWWDQLKEFYQSGELDAWVKNITADFKILANTLDLIAKAIKKVQQAYDFVMNKDYDKLMGQINQKIEAHNAPPFDSSSFKFNQPNDLSYYDNPNTTWIADPSKYFDQFGEPIEVNYQFTGSGSATLPLSEKIAELQTKLNAFTGSVEGTEPNLNVDVSAVSNALDGINSQFQSTLQNMISYIAQSQMGLEDVMGNPTLQSYGIGRLYKGQIELGYSQINDLVRKTQLETDLTTDLLSKVGQNNSLISTAADNMTVEQIQRLVARQPQAGPGPDLSTSMGRYLATTNVQYSMNINVPSGAATSTGVDWRNITRNYIIPELQLIKF